ncbi:hypothetical protein [Lutibacter sp.]|uniref:hypothetical protein n=1 Tax=Lutibacter sp. TaxID=1925666 RepID=UPI001A258987|nr:hypothetical protein [Lutibacter sp.]MBI9041629.1 hypothetical protein [Lutibacter sp.]
MKLLTLPLSLIIATILMYFNSDIVTNKNSQRSIFNIEKDLKLVQFDCKTDVDDLHKAAALTMLMSQPDFSKINYHSVAGTNGIQDGLYVPLNELFQRAFEDNWTDAHENLKEASEKVKNLVVATLSKQGDVWIAEAGQSDFTAKLIQAIQTEIPKLKTSQRIHVVQHSGWNEKVTSTEGLEYVQTSVDYHKIPDGNAVGNWIPGFRNPAFANWNEKFTDPKLVEIWAFAINLANKYNVKDWHYNNEAVSAGGINFSDLSEVCWILGLENIKNFEDFFKLYSK